MEVIKMEFKIGDKVYIPTLDKVSEVVGKTFSYANSKYIIRTYKVCFVLENEPIIASFNEYDLVPKIPTPQEILDVVDEIGIDNLINCFEKENDPMGKAKFKIGDKVHIIAFGDDKIWEVVRIKSVFHCEKWSPIGSDDDTDYFYRIINKDNGSIKALEDVPERHLKLVDDNIVIKFKNGSYIKVIPGESKCSCDCCGHDVCEDSDYNEDFENELDDDEIEDYKYNKSCESLDNDKKFNLENLAQSLTYPQIRDYYYDEKTATTVIKWTDGTTTKVKAAEGDTPDQHTGFANAVAKKYFGNGNLFAKEAKWWIVDEPKYRKEEEEFCKEYDAEQARKEEKRRANREKRIIKAKALARKREYEARKLAAEKYDVPMEWNEDKE